LKTKRFKYSPSSSASYPHKKVGEFLRASSYKNYRIYQEYPVNKINPSFRDGRCKFDWVILDLRVVIEVMGAQHYKPTYWSKSTTQEEAETRYQEIIYRDGIKKKAAEEIGFVYIVIDANDVDTISEDWFASQIMRR